ncbi:MAG: glycine cleavage system protein GcvH [Candidatus Nezhaarchaeales archaeon]
MTNPWDPGTNSVSAKTIKEDRLYTSDHEWAKLEDDGTYTIGITAFAVDQLGDITLVGFDIDPGDHVESGNTFGTIESVKTLSDLFCPVTGEIVAINEELEESPELVNDSVWEDGWLIRIKPDSETSHDTISPEEYAKVIGND